MKKLFFLSLIFLAVSIYGCSQAARLNSAIVNQVSLSGLTKNDVISRFGTTSNIRVRQAPQGLIEEWGYISSSSNGESYMLVTFTNDKVTSVKYY